ncbi:MAG: HEAT repeat domain-containing protein [Planctomycetota bacterium]
MLNGKTITIVFAAGLFAFTACNGQSLEENWNDYLHYALIGRFDMAKAHARAILEGRSDPVALFDLSQANPQGYALLLRAKETPHEPELAQLSGELYNMIELGRFLRRTDPEVIVEEIKRLSTTERGRATATTALKNAGEYVIPFMLDGLADRNRKEEWIYITQALPKIGRDAIRPLAAALQTDNLSVKADIVKALGGIRYPQALPYLKYVTEKEQSSQLRGLAGRSISEINPAALNMPAAELFYRLAQDYYYHAESLAPAEDAEFGNVWFWDANTGRLTSEKVDKGYFYELMAMHECEWALKADPGFGQAIGLWLAAYFKAESTNIEMPNYFGPAHADAMTYATTAGPEYLHLALARAVKDNNAYVALGAVEALAVTAGEKSLLYRLGAAQPLAQALTFNDRAVRYSAAIAIAAAGPKEEFPENILVVRNLAEALAQSGDASGEYSDRWSPELADSYALRAVSVMAKVGQTRNRVIDLSAAQPALMNATKDPRVEIQVLAAQVLAYLDSPDAQRSIAAVALSQDNGLDVRIRAFESLGVSAKLHASLLDNQSIDAIYSLVSSEETEPQLRAAAAAAYGALNLPSQKVKVLILDQAKS